MRSFIDRAGTVIFGIGLAYIANATIWHTSPGWQEGVGCVVVGLAVAVGLRLTEAKA